MATVFISHSSKDKEFVRQLSADLKEAGHTPWLDEWEIQVGDCIVRAVSDGLTRADFVVLVLSPHSVESGWVEKEWAPSYWNEIDTKRRIVLPAMLTNCTVPTLLKTKKYADFRKTYAVGFSQLVNALGPVVQRIEPPIGPMTSEKEKELISCPRCQTEIKAEWKICPSCEVAVRYPQCTCGERIRPHWKRCPSCHCLIVPDGSRFVDCLDGTVFDYELGIYWQKEDNCADISYSEARAFASSLGLAGIRQWRLPTFEMLRSLVAPERHANKVGASYVDPVFINSGWWYWTDWHRQPHGYEYSRSVVYCIGFEDGSKEREAVSVTDSSRLRCRCVANP